jgi:sugar phosphate permease
VASQRWLRIIPVAVVMYTIAYIDRTNISLALPAISHELRMDPQQAGNAAGVFFWGYIVLQIPGGYLARRWSAKRLIGLLLVLWGICAVGGGLVQTERQLRMTRLLLGVAEGGVFPATLVLLTHWFGKTERAQANAYWMLCQPLAVILSAPVSAWILGRWNWRVLLVAEGALPFLWLIVWMLYMDDDPRQARWLSQEERESIIRIVEREAAERSSIAHRGFLPVLFRPLVWLLIVSYFLLNCGGYGFLFWLPSAIGRAGRFSSLTIGLLYSAPYVAAAFIMVLNSWHSDRAGERRRHVALPLAVAGVCLSAAVFVNGYSVPLTFALICLAGAGPYAAIAPFWALPPEHLPREAVGPAVGLINALGALGGYIGPVVVGALTKRFGDFRYAFVALSGGLLVAAGLALIAARGSHRGTETKT